MTKSKVKAEIEQIAREMKGHRKPSKEGDQLAIESMVIQTEYRNLVAEAPRKIREGRPSLQVINYQDVVTELGISIKAAPGGYDEIARMNKAKRQGAGR